MRGKDGITWSRTSQDKTKVRSENKSVKFKDRLRSGQTEGIARRWDKDELGRGRNIIYW